MNPNNRLLAVWNALTAYVIAPLAMLSVVLGWPGFVQLMLTLVMVLAVSIPHFVPSIVRRRR